MLRPCGSGGNSPRMRPGRRRTPADAPTATHRPSARSRAGDRPCFPRPWCAPLRSADCRPVARAPCAGPVRPCGTLGDHWRKRHGDCHRRPGLDRAGGRRAADPARPGRCGPEDCRGRRTRAAPGREAAAAAAAGAQRRRGGRGHRAPPSSTPESLPCRRTTSPCSARYRSSCTRPAPRPSIRPGHSGPSPVACAPRCHGGAREHRLAGGGRHAVRDDRRGMRDVPLLVLVAPPGRPPRRPHRGSRGGDRPGRRNQPRHVRTTRRPRAHGAPLAHEPARPARHDGGPPGPRGHEHGAFGERPLARRPVVEAGGVAPGRAPRRRRVPEAEVAEVRRCGPRRLHRSGRRLLAVRRRPLRPEGPRLHRRALPGVHHRQRPGRHGEGGRDRRARHQPLLSLGAGEGTPGAVRRPAGRRSRRSAPRCGP